MTEIGDVRLAEGGREREVWDLRMRGEVAAGRMRGQIDDDRQAPTGGNVLVLQLNGR